MNWVAAIRRETEAAPLGGSISVTRNHRICLFGASGAAVLSALSLGAAVRAADAGSAAHGQEMFSAKCASCHGTGGTGGEFGPPLKGASFESHWQGKEPGALAEFIAARMPPSAAGTLTADQANDLAAYVRGGEGGAPAPAAQAAPSDPSPPTPLAPGRAMADPGLAAAKAARLAPLDHLTPVTDAMLKRPPAGDWLMWRRTYQTLGFSPLGQIDKANVKSLKAAWSWALPASQNEITPLIHDGVMFVQSGDTVQALSAAKGDLLWQYVHPLPANGSDARGTRVKTMALYGDQLFAAFVDGHVAALNVKSGQAVWDHAVLPAQDASNKGRADGAAFRLDGGPIVARGKVIFGVSLGTDTAKGGCFIVALDAASGSEIWRFHTVAQPGEPGGDSWNGAPANERFGGGVWTAGSYDPDLNLVYFGVGQTYDAATLLEPRDGKVGPNDALYTDSTLALDADTGKLKWHFQHVHRDVWDLDWVFE